MVLRTEANYKPVTFLPALVMPSEVGSTENYMFEIIFNF